MSEQTQNVEKEETKEVAQETPQRAEEPAQKATDVNAIVAEAIIAATKAAEKKENIVKKSVVEKYGFDYDDETVKKALEEFRKNQPKPEDIIKQEREEKLQLANENEELKQKYTAAQMNIPADKIDKYVAYAKSNIKEGTDFKKALEEVLQDMPIKTIPKMAEGTGKNSVSSDDPFLAALHKKRQGVF